MPIKQVTDLRIYQQAMELLPELYRLSASLPERELSNQIQRAGRSIGVNISEGFGRQGSNKEFKRFLSIALGSCDEVQTHLRQSQLLYRVDCAVLIKSYNELSRQINSAIKTWQP